jgi:putative transposase
MVHFSGFYAWRKEPLSPRALEDVRQTEMIQQPWADSGKVYGYRKLHDDLLDQGETCSENRVARLASIAGITAQIGYKRRPSQYGGKPASRRPPKAGAMAIRLQQSQAAFIAGKQNPRRSAPGA